MVMAVGVSEKGGPLGMSRPPFLFSYEMLIPARLYPCDTTDLPHQPFWVSALTRWDDGDSRPFRCHRPALLNSVSASDLWAAQSQRPVLRPVGDQRFRSAVAQRQRW